ncbi:uncharacterized protein LOC109091630 isoform X6 [Cyprinus carpio]|uniref:Uncharacterized protein LOC109091630 isoform X6 n=1 Tax=Cyprinus carpio TaxID=7962 RepID=A0A9Q9XY53_CYPCA|nr:uncharacterized protein LOC109091630 isoform X6 [Cyprinus carpio]
MHSLKEPKWTSPQDLNLDPWHTVVAGVPLSLFLMVEDHSALANRVCPDPFLRESVGVPQGLQLMDRDHSALANRVCPDPFLRESVGVPQGLQLMDGAVAEGVRSSHFCRNGGRVPQSPSHGVRMLLNPQGVCNPFSPSVTPQERLSTEALGSLLRSLRAERDPPNAAKATSMHAHSNKLRKEDFPMSEKKFQKRVLQLLVEIKDTIHIATSSVGTSYEVKPANTEEELNALENRLEDKNEGAELSKHLKRLGGVDAADHVKKSMAATMTNKMMAIMSLRGRSGKVAFMKTRLYKIICDAVFSSFDTTTTKVDEYMAKYLKYAPERMGGGGRKK